MEKIKNILFDLDNTLLDFDYASEQAFFALMTYFEVPEFKNEYSTYHRINHQVWSQLERQEISQKEVRTLRWKLFWDAMDKHFDPSLSNSLYLDFLVDNGLWITGAKEIVEELLNSDYHIFIITNGFKEVQRKRLVREDIINVCDDVVISDEIGYSKPDPRFFDHLFKNNPTMKRAECLIVGDSINSDIKGGEDYGILTCWYNPKEKINDTEVTPTVEIKSMRVLNTYLGLG